MSLEALFSQLPPVDMADADAVLSLVRKVTEQATTDDLVPAVRGEYVRWRRAERVLLEAEGEAGLAALDAPFRQEALDGMDEAPACRKPKQRSQVETRERTSLALHALLREAFPVDGTRWVTYAESTVADHEERIAYLRKLMNGYRKPIGWHESAIKAMVGCGVATFGELPDAVRDGLYDCRPVA